MNVTAPPGGIVRQVGSEVHGRCGGLGVGVGFGLGLGVGRGVGARAADRCRRRLRPQSRPRRRHGGRSGRRRHEHGLRRRRVRIGRRDRVGRRARWRCHDDHPRGWGRGCCCSSTSPFGCVGRKFAKATTRPPRMSATPAVSRTMRARDGRSGRTGTTGWVANGAAAGPETTIRPGWRWTGPSGASPRRRAEVVGASCPGRSRASVPTLSAGGSRALKMPPSRAPEDPDRAESRDRTVLDASPPPGFDHLVRHHEGDDDGRQGQG